MDGLSGLSGKFSTAVGALKAPANTMFPTCRIPAGKNEVSELDGQSCAGKEQYAYMAVLGMATQTMKLYQKMLDPDPREGFEGAGCSTSGLSCIKCVGGQYKNQIEKRKNELVAQLQKKVADIEKMRQAYNDKVREQLQPTYDALYAMDDEKLEQFFGEVMSRKPACQAYKSFDEMRRFFSIGSGNTGSKGLADLESDMTSRDSVVQSASEFNPQKVKKQVEKGIDAVVNSMSNYNDVIGGEIAINSNFVGDEKLSTNLATTAEGLRAAIAQKHKNYVSSLEKLLDRNDKSDQDLLAKLSNEPEVNLQNALTIWSNDSLMSCVYRINGNASSTSQFLKNLLDRYKGKVTLGDSERDQLYHLFNTFFSLFSSSTLSMDERLHAFNKELSTSVTTYQKLVLSTNNADKRIVGDKSAIGITSYLQRMIGSCVKSSLKKNGLTVASVKKKVQEIGNQIKALQANYRNNFKQDLKKKLMTCEHKEMSRWGSSKECSKDAFDLSSGDFCYASTERCAKSLNDCRNEIGQRYSQKKRELDQKRNELNKEVRKAIKDLNQETINLAKAETKIIQLTGVPMSFFPDLSVLKNLDSSVKLEETKPETFEGFEKMGKPELLSMDQIEKNYKTTMGSLIEQHTAMQSEVTSRAEEVSKTVKESLELGLKRQKDFIRACSQAYGASQSGKDDNTGAEEGGKQQIAKFCRELGGLVGIVTKDTTDLPCSDRISELAKLNREIHYDKADPFLWQADLLCKSYNVMNSCASGKENQNADECAERRVNYEANLKALKASREGLGESFSTQDCIDKVTNQNPGYRVDSKSEDDKSSVTK